MEPSITVTRTGSETIIHIQGRFTGEMHTQFRNAYHKEVIEEDQDRHIVIDLAGTEYIDSSGLGMLLLMRAYTRSEVDVEIVNACPEVRKILTTANFERMFKLT